MDINKILYSAAIKHKYHHTMITKETVENMLKYFNENQQDHRAILIFQPSSVGDFHSMTSVEDFYVERKLQDKNYTGWNDPVELSYTPKCKRVDVSSNDF